MVIAENVAENSGERRRDRKPLKTMTWRRAGAPSDAVGGLTIRRRLTLPMPVEQAVETGGFRPLLHPRLG